MALNTVLLDFSVDPTKLLDGSIRVSERFETVLRYFLRNLKCVSTVQNTGDSLNVYVSDGGIISTLRTFDSGLVTLNIEFVKTEGEEAPISFEQCQRLERDILSTVKGVQRGQVYVPIKRGTFIRYFPTSDDRLLEYDIDKLVFEQQSQYQKVQIVHSRTLGNMLVLDDLQNISESDLIYTRTLMSHGIEDYKDKEILILGGGDGALLYELLNERPKNVIMVEIDEVVMMACAKYMRSICGNVLDNLNGPNYQIIVGDCVKSIEQYIEEGRKFDYIFGDLTDVPISEAPTGAQWAFINQILSMSLKILKPDGKYMTHVIGSAAEEAIKMYNSQLAKLEPPVKYTTSHAFVPSFLEDWVFYQLSFDRQE